MSDHDPYKPTDDKEIGPNPWKKLQRAENLFDLTVKERREMFKSGNLTVIEAGLCDGQFCINHVVKPHGVRGCTCRFASPKHPRGLYFRDRHQIVCTHNGDNEVKELGCDGFRGDPKKIHDRKKPAYMKKAYAERIIPDRLI